MSKAHKSILRNKIMNKNGKVRENNKSPENERIWSCEDTSILADFIKIKQLVDEHYKIRRNK